jgi:hypothetical protein
MLPKVSSTLELQALGWSFVYSAGGMGNGEFQVYDDTNCHPLRDGGVYIQATITQGCLVDKGITGGQGNQSAWVGKGNYLYGLVGAIRLDYG